MSSVVVEEPFQMICSYCKRSFNPRSDARILPCNHFICGPYSKYGCVSRMILNRAPECPSNTCRVTFPKPFITYNLPRVDMICSFCKKSFNPRSDARILPCNHFICGPYSQNNCVTRMILNEVPECPSNTCRVTFPKPFHIYKLPKVDKQNGAGKSSVKKKKGQ